MTSPAAALRSLSIKNKLQAIIMLTVATALLFVFGLFGTWGALRMRNSMKVEMEVLGGMIGANSAAAVSFNDREAAGDLLQGLSAQPAIRIGRIHLPNGQVFAEYRRLDVPEEIAADPGEHRTAFEGSRLVLHRSIALDGQPIGSIYLESDLRDLEQWRANSALIALAVLAISGCAAFLLALRLQRLISDPVIHLAQTAKAVTLFKNYGIRARKQNDDEIGLLITGFNEMLGEIQQRDQDLQIHHREHGQHRLFATRLGLLFGWFN